MRFLPLLSSGLDPAPWQSIRAVELAVDGASLAPWIGAKEAGLEVHALHGTHQDWPAEPAALPLADLGRLSPDFLVLPVAAPADRLAASRLLAATEALLEVLRGRDTRLVFCPEPGHAEALVALLGDVRAEAVAWCWAPGLPAELLADRLACAVAEAGADLAPLAALGYRWNVAVPGADATTFIDLKARLEATWPPPLPPAIRPVSDTDLPLAWGSAWGEAIPEEDCP